MTTNESHADFCLPFLPIDIWLWKPWQPRSDVFLSVRVCVRDITHEREPPTGKRHFNTGMDSENRSKLTNGGNCFNSTIFTFHRR